MKTLETVYVPSQLTLTTKESVMTPLDYPIEATSLTEYLFLTGALVGMVAYAFWLAGQQEQQPNHYIYNRKTGNVERDED